VSTIISLPATSSLYTRRLASTLGHSSDRSQGSKLTVVKGQSLPQSRVKADRGQGSKSDRSQGLKLTTVKGQRSKMTAVKGHSFDRSQGSMLTVVKGQK